MTFRCRACNWSGEDEDRVPASLDWIQEHGVDPDHFLSHGLNCPECGEASWILEGDDDEDLPDYVPGEE